MARPRVAALPLPPSVARRPANKHKSRRVNDRGLAPRFAQPRNRRRTCGGRAPVAAQRRWRRVVGHHDMGAAGGKIHHCNPSWGGARASIRETVQVGRAMGKERGRATSNSLARIAARGDATEWVERALTGTRPTPRLQMDSRSSALARAEDAKVGKLLPGPDWGCSKAPWKAPVAPDGRRGS